MTQQLTKYRADVPVEWYGNAGQLSDEQRQVITAIAKGATKNQLAVFFGICERYRLDPFDASGQVWFVKRQVWNADTRQNDETYSVQIGVAGLRLIAARTGEYQGEIGPEWSKDGAAWSPFWTWDDPPMVARVGVRRRGFPEPLWAYATWQESAQLKRDGTPMSLWKTRPSFMLGKCAEAQALKRAFPAELGSLSYTLESDEDQPRRMQVREDARIEDLYPDSPMDRPRLAQAAPIPDDVIDIPATVAPEPAAARPAPAAAASRQGIDPDGADAFWKRARALGLKLPHDTTDCLGVATPLAYLKADSAHTWGGALALLNSTHAPVEADPPPSEAEIAFYHKASEMGFATPAAARSQIARQFDGEPFEQIIGGIGWVQAAEMLDDAPAAEPPLSPAQAAMPMTEAQVVRGLSARGAH